MDRVEVLTGLQLKAKELLDLDPSVVTEQASFQHDLEVDSLDLVEYTMAVEDYFDVQLGEDDLTGLTSIGEFVTLVLAKCEHKQQGDGYGTAGEL